jgi:hypothetical protein
MCNIERLIGPAVHAHAYALARCARLDSERETQHRGDIGAIASLRDPHRFACDKHMKNKCFTHAARTG